MTSAPTNGSRFRIGIIGAGFFAQVAHLPHLTARTDLQVVALAEPHPRLRDPVADRFGIAARFADHREMIAAATLDGVVVAVPRRAQSAVVRAVVTAGLPVLSEKPLAYRADTAAALAAQARGNLLMVGYMRRHDAGVRLFAERLDDALQGGGLGHPLHATMHDFCGTYAIAVPPHLRPPGPRPTRYPEDSCLPEGLDPADARDYDRSVNVAVHDLNLLRSLFRQAPRSLAFRCRPGGAQAMLIDVGACDVALSVAPADSGRWDQRLDVVFQKGILSLVLESPLALQGSARVILRRPGRDDRIAPAPDARISAFANQAAAFVEALGDRTAAVPDVVEAIADLRLIEDLWRCRCA